VQVEALKRGVEVVVGTPGRLEDLMQDGICKLHVRAVACVLCLPCCLLASMAHCL
jgi:superfamily II DNA/RNA helicase